MGTVSFHHKAAAIFDEIGLRSVISSLLGNFIGGKFKAGHMNITSHTVLLERGIFEYQHGSFRVGDN
jgi:hypothetical protein